MRHPHDTLTTARLALRRLTADDLDLLHRLESDPRVMQYVGGPQTREQVVAMLRDRVLAYYDAHPGLGVWATLERSTGECVGIHNLNHIRGEPHVQVGYILFAEAWGRGYATEMTVALLRYGFTDLGLPQIVGIVDRPHLASQHVLLKAGLRRNGERSFAHPAYAAASPFAWFERDAADWLAEHPA